MLVSFRQSVEAVSQIHIAFKMKFGMVFALLLVSVVSVYSQGLDLGGLGGHGHHHLEEYIDYKAPPKYHFDYAVHDHHHHDFHSQHEVRDGKDVKGEYELLQPDGRKRIVKYHAGKHGADYQIHYEGKSHHGGVGSFGLN